MKNRDDMNAVIASLHKHNALLAAYLQATDKIDWRALQRRAAIGETPVNLEAGEEASTALNSPASPFAFRRANLVRASE